MMRVTDVAIDDAERAIRFGVMFANISEAYPDEPRTSALERLTRALMDQADRSIKLAQEVYARRETLADYNPADMDGDGQVLADLHILLGDRPWDVRRQSKS